MGNRTGHAESAGNVNAMGVNIVRSLRSRLDLFDGERAGSSLNPRPQIHGLAQIDFDGTAGHRKAARASR